MQTAIKIADRIKELGIHPTICNNLEQNFGITHSTSVQAVLVRSLIEGREMILKDMTGAGKTFGCLIAILSLSLIETPTNEIKKLFLIPNRELALQVSNWSKLLLPPYEPIKKDTKSNLASPELDPKLIQIVYREDESELFQHKLLNQMPHLLVGTSKKVMDLFKIRRISFNQVDTIVLDEIDSQLKLAAKYATLKERWNREVHPKPVQKIVSKIIKDKKEKAELINEEMKLNIVALSATINSGIRKFLRDNYWMTKPVYIDTVHTSPCTPPTITHWCVLVGEDYVRNINMTKPESNPTLCLTDQDEIQTEDLDQEQINNEPIEEAENRKSKYKKINIDHTSENLLNTLSSIIIMSGLKEALLFIPDGMSTHDYVGRLKRCGIDARELSELYSSELGRGRRKINEESYSEQPLLHVSKFSHCRGIDLPYLTHVIILSTPQTPNDYLHMAGRTARMGRYGNVISVLVDRFGTESKMRTLFKNFNANVVPCPFIED